jgi:hypothetical protein
MFFIGIYLRVYTKFERDKDVEKALVHTYCPVR